MLVNVSLGKLNVGEGFLKKTSLFKYNFRYIKFFLRKFRVNVGFFRKIHATDCFLLMLNVGEVVIRKTSHWLMFPDQNSRC